MSAFGGLVGQDALAHFGLAHLGDPLGQRETGDLLIARIEHERIARQLQPDHQTYWAREHLGGDRGVRIADGVVLLDHRDRVGPDRIAGITRRQRERHRKSVVLRGLENLLQHIGVTARGDIRHELNQPAACLGHAGRDRVDLRLCSVVRRDQLATRGLVEREPRRRETERAHLDGLPGQRAHPVEILGSRGLTIGAAPAHHVHPQR